MKYPPYRSIAASLTLISLLVLSQTHRAIAESDKYDVKLAQTGPDGVTSIKAGSGRVLRIEDPGITISDDTGGNGKALTFSGKQHKPAVLSRPFENPTSVSLKAKVKPSAEAGDTDQTIFMHPGNFELRYSPRRKEVTLFVNYKEKTMPVSVHVPLTPGKWNSVAIVVKGQDVSLKVDETPVTEKLPEGTMAGAKSYVRIGATADGVRPFSGALADLVIAEPAE